MVNNYHLGEFEERAWGNWMVLFTGEHCVTKVLNIYPSKSISLQTHNYRHEHWIIVSGEATVQLGHQVFHLGSNRHILIPIGEFHRVTNEVNLMLTIIEVQYGSILSEDDIIRYDDNLKPIQ